jgi:hypothetical protein
MPSYKKYLDQRFKKFLRMTSTKLIRPCSKNKNNFKKMIFILRQRAARKKRLILT